MLATPSTAVPMLSVDAETSGHSRGVRIKGASGFWLKLKLSVMSLAFASRSPSAGSPKRSSINFSTDANSYCVVETYAFRA